jgi:hypothetical protein
MHPITLTRCPLNSVDAHARGHLNGVYQSPLLLKTP